MKSLILIAAMLLSVPSVANVLGDMQTFVPNTDGLDFITVHSSRPLNEGFFAVGGHFSYAKDHLQVFRTLQGQELLNYKDQLVEFDTDISYAFTKRFAAFLAVPTLLWQESKGGQPVDVEITEGIHAFRPGFKWNLGDSNDSPSVLASVDIMNVSNSPYTGIDPKPALNIEFAKNWSRPERVTYGTNIGYRMREPTETPLDAQMFPLDDQVTFSLARSAPLFTKTGWVLEGIFSIPVDKDPYKKMIHAASVDLLVGIKHRLGKNLNLDAGMTVEPFVDSQSPHLRVFTGLVYYFKPAWLKSRDEVAPPKEEVVVPAATVDSEMENLVNESYVPPARKTGELSVNPEYVEIFEGSSVDYQVFSYNEPITMELIDGGGAVYESEFRYRAPLRPGKARVRFTDAIGKTVVSRILIKRVPKADKEIRIKNLNFEFDTANLIPSSRTELQKTIKVLAGRKFKQIVVEGHTDSKGSDDYNAALSERRANTVRKILIQELRLKPSQVVAVGYGESRPIATNKTDAGRLTNRRCDLKIFN